MACRTPGPNAAKQGECALSLIQLGKGQRAVVLERPLVRDFFNGIREQAENARKTAFAVECGLPGCANPGKKKCARCCVVYYCSKECQDAHWIEHKEFCKRMALVPR